MADPRDRDVRPSPDWVPLTKRVGDLTSGPAPLREKIIEVDDLPANRVAVELQNVNARLEILHAERMKLELRRDALQSRLLETVDLKLNLERAREWASRVSVKAPPKVTYRCRYCVKQTRKLYGGLPVCDECRYQIEFDLAIEKLED